MSQPKTPEAVRAAAASHYALQGDIAARSGVDAALARAESAFGLQLVEAILALPAGAEFSMELHLPANVSRDDGLRQVLGHLPYLIGSLGLLDFEFSHPVLGVLPLDVVSSLLRATDPFEHQGVSLRQDNVYVSYRRQALS